MPHILTDLFHELVQAHSTVRDALATKGHGVPYRLVYYVLDIRVFVVCLAPLILLERARPARPKGAASRASFWFDWSYPIWTIGLVSYAVVPVVLGVQRLYLAVWPAGPSAYVGSMLPQAAQFAIAFVVQDFIRFASHYVRHKVRWFWRFHSIHHSQVNLNAATTHRAHPFEAITGIIVFAVPIGLIGTDPVPWVYAGLTGLFWDFFIHSNVRTNLGSLGKFVVSPQFHRVHHSALPEHIDRNFGERLVIWDIIFRTRCEDQDCYPATGCAESPLVMERRDQRLWVLMSWWRQFAYPFRETGASRESSLREVATAP